jgi:geranylgeranyl diphosphate synthase, type I
VIDVAEQLALERNHVNMALERFFDRERAVADSVHAQAREVFDAVVDFTLGPGKRLRPVLMIMGYRAVGGKDEEAILAASCCLELTQTMLLIHDDIMDKSELRRGMPSVHVEFAHRYGGTGMCSDPEHFGLALAIAAGDLAGQLALRALAGAGFADERMARAVGVYTAMTRDVCYGQVLDMHAGDLCMSLSEQDVLLIHRYKTARYTTEGPLHLGAVLAGAADKTLDVLSSYALPLGQAFQLQDDVLGVFGNEEETGKPADADLKQGKRTLLVLKALEWGNADQRTALLSALGNASATAEEVAAARRVLEATGARRYCQERTQELAEQARASLASSTLQEPPKSFLLDLIAYVAQRAR